MEIKSIFLLILCLIGLLFINKLIKNPGLITSMFFGKDSDKLKNLINENERLGFKKKIICFYFLPNDIQNRVLTNRLLNGWLDGIWINYQDKQIKFRYDFDRNDYIIIPFENLYDVGIDRIVKTKTMGLGFVDTIALFGTITTESLKNITIKIITKDPNGGLKTIKLVLYASIFSLKRGTPQANAFEECAAGVINEISYIIDNF